MPLAVAPRLKCRAAPAHADAFLLRGADQLPAALSLPGDRPPHLFRIAGGFLAVAADPTAERLPGAIALRRLAGDLFVPAAADLVPELLPDESAGLTRGVGLVILPGGAVLAFDPHSPLAPSVWLKLPTIVRADWGPLPAPEPLVDRLTIIERPPTPAEVESLLGEGEPGGRAPLAGNGESATATPEDARPPSVGLLDRARAGAAFAAGSALAFLGALAKSGALARAGADLIRRAVERAPRLSERVLGEQEAALRELLRQLKSGDVEQALMRAPIAVGDPSAPARVDHGSKLSARDSRYSLAALLGGGGGVASAWFGGGDVWHSLAAEYRRLAAEAVARGDYRRAAYLHGVLLRDLRSAAAVLLRGGLFRDAALIYRDKLSDLGAAARAFEQAGDSDEAVRLYERAGLDVNAGDLLAKLGLADRAAMCFTIAANKLAESGKFIAAGDLMRTKLGDRTALVYYRGGWDGGSLESAACGERLFDAHLVASDFAAAQSLLAEAEAMLAPPRLADAGRFFNHARHVGADFLTPEMRDDLDDQSRRLFAAHLRAGADRGAASQLFGGWDGAVARDAIYSTRKLGAPDAVVDLVQRLTAGNVVALAAARDTRDIAVATDVAVVLWRPDAGKVLWVCGTGRERVTGLVIEPDGRHVYVLLDDGHHLRLDSCDAAGWGKVERRAVQHYAGAGGRGWFISPAPSCRGVMLDMAGVRGAMGRDLVYSRDFEKGVTPAVLVVDDERGWRWEWATGTLRATDEDSGAAREFAPHWTPTAPTGQVPFPPPLDWRRPSPFGLEVAGVDADGVLHWAEWDAPLASDIAVRQASLADAAKFVAACLTGAGRVAAVDAQNRVHWLRFAGGSLTPTSPAVRIQAPARAVALVARPHAGEVVAILADATAARLRLPGG